MKRFLTLAIAFMMLALTACGGNENTNAPTADADLQSLYDTLAEEFQWEEGYLVDIEGEMLESYYPGLSEINTKQFIAKMPMMSSVVNEIVFLQCETEDDAAKAAEILQNRIDYQVGDENNPGGAWYPESIEGWEKNSRIVSNGNYVMMIAWNYCDEAVEAFNALF